MMCKERVCDLCVSSLRRGHANLLCLFIHLVYDPLRRGERVRTHLVNGSVEREKVIEGRFCENVVARPFGSCDYALDTRVVCGCVGA